jgi:cell division protein FtsB
MRASVHTALFRRLIWNVLPVVLVTGALWMALAGEDGLLRRHELKHQLAATKARTENVLLENQALRREIRALRSEQAAVQRASATTLLTAQPGSTIYRFID